MVDDDVIVWNDYEVYAAGANNGVIGSYKGPFTDWAITATDFSWHIPILVDLTLYADYTEVGRLRDRFDESTLNPKQVIHLIVSLNEQEVDDVAENLVEYIWFNGIHHWGKLLDKKVSDKTFIEEYLFRFLEQMRHYGNWVDEDYRLEDGDFVYFTDKIMEDFRNDVENDGGLTVDEYMLARGGFGQIYSRHAQTPDESCKRNCIRRTADMIEYLQDNASEYYFWGKPTTGGILSFATSLGRGIVFGDYTDYLDKKVLPASLAEYVVGLLINDELAKYYGDFADVKGGN